jgi:CheY-like chemotaxis protein
MQRTLFFIDDSPTMVEAIQTLLPKQLWNVTATTSDEEAIQLLGATGYDIYLFDFLLKHPEGTLGGNTRDGNELVQLLRKMPTYKETAPIVYMSGIKEEQRIRAHNSGKSWMKEYNQYWIPRDRNKIEVISDALLEIMKHHHGSQSSSLVGQVVNTVAKELVDDLTRKVLTSSNLEGRTAAIKANNAVIECLEQINTISNSLSALNAVGQVAHVKDATTNIREAKVSLAEAAKNLTTASEHILCLTD